MAQKNKPAAEQPVAIQTDAPVIEHGEAVEVTEFPVNDFKGPMIFDLDPKEHTSIINGNRVVLLRGGVESVTVTARK